MRVHNWWSMELHLCLPQFFYIFAHGIRLVCDLFCEHFLASTRHSAAAERYESKILNSWNLYIWSWNNTTQENLRITKNRFNFPFLINLHSSPDLISSKSFSVSFLKECRRMKVASCKFFKAVTCCHRRLPENCYEPIKATVLGNDTLCEVFNNKCANWHLGQLSSPPAATCARSWLCSLRTASLTAPLYFELTTKSSCWTCDQLFAIAPVTVFFVTHALACANFNMNMKPS